MKGIIIASALLLLASCFPAKPSNAIEGLAEEVILKKEGVDIRLTPVDDPRPSNAAKK
jgi:hypothetical protein